MGPRAFLPTIFLLHTSEPPTATKCHICKTPTRTLPPSFRFNRGFWGIDWTGGDGCARDQTVKAAHVAAKAEQRSRGRRRYKSAIEQQVEAPAAAALATGRAASAVKVFSVAPTSGGALQGSEKSNAAPAARPHAGLALGACVSEASPPLLVVLCNRRRPSRRRTLRRRGYSVLTSMWAASPWGVSS